MRLKYDEQADVIYILLKDAPVAESDESRPGVVLDYDAQGEVVGIEILQASMRTSAPAELEIVRAA